MLIIPAIDLRNGKCVRLLQGRADAETVFSDDPISVAKRWEAGGAELIHVVDLDGAFTGEPRNFEVIRNMIEAINVPIEVGGGIRSMDTIVKFFEIGVSRVILGTAAIEDQKLLEEAYNTYGEKIVVGIDAKDGMVAVKGWVKKTGVTAVDLGCDLRTIGIKEIIFTDVKRDGTLIGPNLASIEEMAEKTGLKVIASGGISSLKDIEDLKALETKGVYGVIIGKALYTNAFTLERAIAISKGLGED